jgi:transmembrane sensor
VALPGLAVATVERADPAAAGLQPGASVRIGEWIETTAQTRVALRFADDTSVRFDAASRARALSAHVIELTAGAVYIDSAPASAGFEIQTPTATVRDVGTRFEVRVQNGATRVRVRSGKVELRSGTRVVAGEAGTEVTMSVDGAVSRPVLSFGAEWDWTASVAPVLDIEGLVLSAFLDRIAREHGWTVRYADTALARDATAIVLHGSVRGLLPADAVQVAVTTSGLAHRLEDGVLTVTRLPVR